MMLPTLGSPQQPKSTKQPLPSVGEWDYKTAEKNQRGKELPKDALGWKPDGTPNFSDGTVFGSILGKMKEYHWMFTRDIPQPSTEDWQAIKDKWQAGAEHEQAAMQTGDQTMLQQGRAESSSSVAQAVSTAWKAGAAQGSIVSPILRGVEISVKALGDIFNIPAQLTEQAIGAGQSLQEADTKLASPLFQLDESPVTAWLRNTPIGSAWRLARIALSPSQDKWSTVQKSVSEGWQAGRIQYSQVFDDTIREQYLRRYRAGENPELLALELQNPLAEVGGQLILDPLNFAGWIGKATHLAGEIDKASDAVKASGLLANAEAAKAFSAIEKTTDEAEALRNWQIVLKAQQNSVDAVQGGRLINNTFTASALTQGSRYKLFMQKSQDFMGLLVSTLKADGRGFDEMADAVRAGVLSVSKNPDDMQRGLTMLSHLPNPHLWVNDDALTTWSVVRNLITGENGAIDGKKLLSLAGKTDLPSFAEQAGKLLKAASENQFPSVQEMKKAASLAEEAIKSGGTVSRKTQEMAATYKSLSPAVKALDEINNVLSKPKGWINKVLSLDYFGLRGGTAVKNLLSNIELILVDKGPSAWFKDGKYWSLGAAEEYLSDVYGFKTAATHGFDTLATAEGGARFGFGKVMDAGERAAASRIVAAATRDTMAKLLKPGLALPELETLTNAGLTTVQAKQYAKFIYQHNGNTEKALASFRAMYATGSADKWRHLDFLTKFQEGALHDLGMGDDFMEFARSGGKTTADVEAYFIKLRKVITDRSAEAVKDAVRVSEDHPALDLLSHLDEQVKAGYIDPGNQEVFKAVMEASQQAKNEYMDALNQSVRLVTNQLYQQGKVDVAQKLGKEYDAVFKAFLEGGSETKKVTTDLLFSTRQWSEEIKGLKNPVPEELASYWRRANLAGAPPLDLSKQSLLETLWSQHRDTVSTHWNTYFGTLFQQSEDIVGKLGKYTDKTTLEASFTRARYATQQAQAYRGAVYSHGRINVVTKTPEWTAWATRKRNEFDDAMEIATPQQKTLLQEAVDKLDKLDVNGAEYSKANLEYEVLLYEVTGKSELTRDPETFALFKEAFPEIGTTGDFKPTINDKIEKFLRPGIEFKGTPTKTTPIPPPAVGTPSAGMAWNQNAKGALQMLDEIRVKILEDFGQRVPGDYNPQIENALREYAVNSADRISEAKAISLKVATEQRNFTLLNYGERTYADTALSYIMPYHFFYSRQYANLGKRIAQHPDIVAGYAKYKHFLEGLHADLPDWYKQQLNINPFAGEGTTLFGQQVSEENPLEGKEVLGIPLDHPLFINLEASVNPIYGLTGTDFTDPQKRVDWFSSSVDDVGKFGPSMWAPIQMGMAAYYASKGQEDAASRWGSRLFPITGEIKTASSFLPFLKKPVELDPAVNLFSGGIDPYESSRVGVSLLDWQNQQISAIESSPNLNRQEKDQLIGEIQAQADTAAFDQQGDVWDSAYKNAVQKRAPTVAGGWLFGVGFKVRSQADVQVQQMYTDMNSLFAVSDTMSSDQYRIKWDELRSKYPGMDAVLLSKKGGETRDAAYAYNVLSRLPPGKLTDVLEAVGINSQDVSKFYDSKGFTNKSTTWTATEKDRFMAAVVDLSAMLNIPPDATRQEWTAARNAYAQAQEGVKKSLGDDIWDKVSLYYDLKDDSPQKADTFRQLHPEVTQALQAMRDAKVRNPLLSAYYGGLDTVSAYVDGKVRQRLSDKYGADIYDLQTEYYEKKVADPRLAKSFLSQHPELKQFWGDKADWSEQANRQFLALSKKIPPAQGIGIRPDFSPQSGAQEQMLTAAQGTQLAWGDYAAEMSPALRQRVVAYWQNGVPLTKAANDELDYLADRFGLYNGDALLRQAGAVLTTQSGLPTLGTP